MLCTGNAVNSYAVTILATTLNIVVMCDILGNFNVFYIQYLGGWNYLYLLLTLLLLIM